MEMVNGYVFVDLTGENVYKKALGAIRAKKPVLVKDYDQIYYADTIAISGTSVIIRKGGKTITITNANAVSSTGDIQKQTKYLHQIQFVYAPRVSEGLTPYAYIDFNVSILNDTNEEFTLEGLLDYLKTNEIDVIPTGFTWVNGDYEHVCTNPTKINTHSTTTYALYVQYEISSGGFDNHYYDLNVALNSKFIENIIEI